jgi:hypothetical protein
LAGALVSILLTPLDPDLAVISIGLSGLGAACLAVYFLIKRDLVPALGMGAFLAVVFTLPALATDGVVTVPWGDWVASLASEHVKETVLVVVIWLYRKVLYSLPVSLYAGLQTLRVEQLLEHAINYGFNAVPGAVRGRVLSINLANDVIAEILQYAIDRAPTLVRWAGGADALRKMIVARLELEPEASAFRLGIGA